MGMFAFLSTQTLIIVLVVALIVFGPQKLPDIGRQLGSAMRELRKMSGDMQRALDLDSHTSSYDYYGSSRYDSASSYSYTPPSDTPLDQYGLDHSAPPALESADHSGVEGDGASAESAAVESTEAEKPKRKRSRKADVNPELSDGVSADGAAVAEGSGSDVEPKPRRSRRKVAESAVAEGDSGDAVLVEPKSTRSRKHPAGESSGSDAVESTAMVADAPEAESVSTPAA